MRSHISGFTLVELIVTILVMTILLGIGVPSYMQFKKQNVLLGAAQGLYSDLQFASSEAVKRNTDNIAVSFFSTTGAWCYRVSDNASCNSCTSAACDIHGDGIIRGGSQTDYPNVTINIAGASGAITTIPVQARRATMVTSTVTFTYGTDTTMQAQVATSLLGRVSICTPSGAVGITGVDPC